MLEEFLNQIGLSYSLKEDIDSLDYDLESDYTNFNYVDGEEGDNGVIKYYHEGNLVAIKTVYGGDSEQVEFSKYGKKIYSPIANAIFLKQLATRVDLIEE